MDTETITQKLARMFDAPLPDFYTRRIVFWHDEEREFADTVADFVPPSAKLLVLNGTNSFAAKRQLEHDDPNSNYLVYDPLPHDDLQDNWLLNIELYSREFRADLISMWVDELQLPATQDMRSAVKGYRKFFAAQSRRAVFVRLNNGIATKGQLHLSVMAAICGLKKTDPNAVLRAVLGAPETMDKLTEYGADAAFWQWCRQFTGYDAAEPTVQELAYHMLLTAASRTLAAPHLHGLGQYISPAHQAYCYDFVSEWLHGEDKRALYDLTRETEAALRLPQRFAQLPTDALLDTEVFPCVHECILASLMNEIVDRVIQVEPLTAAVEKRRTMAWHKAYDCYYDGILQVAKMQQFMLDHAAGFHTAEAKKLWREYTADYYKMDSYYRLFHRAFGQSLTAGCELLDDAFKHVADQVEGLYAHWFMGGLAENWSNVSAEELAQAGHVIGIPLQENFYRDRVQNAGARVFVIISDAFRYEAAAELAGQLRQETQSRVTLESLQGIYPTITKFGMAALLPHKKLTAAPRTSGDLAILADGQSTDANNRDKVLKAANPNSVALQYKSIIGMKRAERAELVRGMEVVYIYHNKVDDASHTADDQVFPACEEAIGEIKNLVRIILNEFGGTQVYITADHGFLYTYSPLKEDAKVDGTLQNAVEVGRRYVLAPKDADAGYLLPVRLLDGQSDYAAFAPRENVRIRKSGAGMNFVHGGISLQEMVVPLIDLHYLRSNTKAYQNNRDRYDTKPVELALLSSVRKVSNMIFSLDFYQKDPVGGNRTAATYELYFTDAAGAKVSDTVTVIADRSAADAQERKFRCAFHMKQMKFDRIQQYYLVIADKSGLSLPTREQFQVDLAFAFDDFGFDI